MGTWDLAVGELSEKTGMSKVSKESEDAKNSLKL